jgi:VCBS repeat-containing protein
MRKLILLLTFACVCNAATRVLDTIERADRTMAVGKIALNCQKITAEGVTVVADVITLTIGKSADGSILGGGSALSSGLVIHSGVVDVTLFAHDTATPSGSSCRARYSLTDDTGRPTNSYEETWLVPTASGTIKIPRVNTTPSPRVLFNFDQLNATALANGKYCTDVTGGVASLTTSGCPGSGGGGGLSEYVAALSGTSTTILASTHGLGTIPAVATCKDAAGIVFEPGGISINGSGDVAITSTSSMSGGFCILTGSAAGTGEYIAALSGTSVTVLASTHGLGVNVAVPTCYDGSGVVFEPGSITINGSGDVAIVSVSSMSGSCILQ